MTVDEQPRCASQSPAVTPPTLDDTASLATSYPTSPFKQFLAPGSAIPTPQDSITVTTMPQVRAAIDRLDQEIVTLLGTRLRFIEAAARIKEDRGKVRDEWRKWDVIQKAKGKAKEVGMDEDILGRVYEELVEGSIAYEGVKWEELRR